MALIKSDCGHAAIWIGEKIWANKGLHPVMRATDWGGDWDALEGPKSFIEVRTLA